MKKPSEQFKKFIKDNLIDLRKAYFCGEYEMSVEYMDEDKKSGNTDCMAEIDIDTTYLNFTVNIYPILERNYKEKKFDKIIEILSHEIAHILTEPLYKVIMDLYKGANIHQNSFEEVREQQTQRITNVVNNFYMSCKKRKKRK